MITNQTKAFLSIVKNQIKIKNELKEKYKKMQLIKELNVLPRNIVKRLSNLDFNTLYEVTYKDED